jgi:hypothetical protein
MFSGNGRKNAAEFFFLLLRDYHLNVNLEYSKQNSGYKTKT